MIKMKVNGRAVEVDIPEDVPLLWLLREELGLTGTKFGCGKALCGACTVHVDGQARRSCTFASGDAHQRSVETIEGFAPGDLHAIQRAWIAEDVAQCGYCQPGQIMQVAALLKANPNPSDEEIDAGLSANLCRCGTYPRIRKAVKLAAQWIAGQDDPGAVSYVCPMHPQNRQAKPGTCASCAMDLVAAQSERR